MTNDIVIFLKIKHKERILSWDKSLYIQSHSVLLRLINLWSPLLLEVALANWGSLAALTCFFNDISLTFRENRAPHDLLCKTKQGVGFSQGRVSIRRKNICLDLSEKPILRKESSVISLADFIQDTCLHL